MVSIINIENRLYAFLEKLFMFYRKYFVKYWKSRGECGRMRLRKWNNYKVVKLKKRKEGENMATVTFDKTISLNSLSAKKLINKIEQDKKNCPKFKKIDVQKELKDSALSLKRLLSR